MYPPDWFSNQTQQKMWPVFRVNSRLKKAIFGTKHAERLARGTRKYQHGLRRTVNSEILPS